MDHFILLVCDSIFKKHTSNDDRVNDKYYTQLESVLCEENDSDTCEEVLVNPTPDMCGCG